MIVTNKGSTLVSLTGLLCRFRLLKPQIPHIAYQVHRDYTNLFFVAVWPAVALEAEHEWEFQIHLNYPGSFQPSLVAQVEKNVPAVQETQGLEDPLEKWMASHSNILAWRIPWTEESGGLESMGLQRVGPDW